MSAEAEFQRALRRTVPRELLELEDSVLMALTELADAERVRRDAELTDSLTEALKEVPLPLRGVAKRAVIR